MVIGTVLGLAFGTVARMPLYNYLWVGPYPAVALR